MGTLNRRRNRHYTTLGKMPTFLARWRAAGSGRVKNPRHACGNPASIHVWSATDGKGILYLCNRLTDGARLPARDLSESQAQHARNKKTRGNRAKRSQASNLLRLETAALRRLQNNLANTPLTPSPGNDAVPAWNAGFIRQWANCACGGPG